MLDIMLIIAIATRSSMRVNAYFTKSILTPVFLLKKFLETTRQNQFTVTVTKCIIYKTCVKKTVDKSKTSRCSRKNSLLCPEIVLG